MLRVCCAAQDPSTGSTDSVPTEPWEQECPWQPVATFHAQVTGVPLVTHGVPEGHGGT